MKNKLSLLLVCLLVHQLICAQIPPQQEAAIYTHQSGAVTTFRAELPVLQAIPGGRAPFYTYLWDFGDGHFSTEEAPQHVYRSDGDYEVKLYATNNYDFGTRPPRPKKPVKVNEKVFVAGRPASVAEQNFFTANGVFQLSKNADALPGEDMVIVAGVRSPDKGKGKVLLLTNEKIYGAPGFVYRGQSQYNNEKIIPGDSLQLQPLWASVQKVTITQSGSPDYGNRADRSLTTEEAIRYFSNLYKSYRTVATYEVQTKADTAQFSLINLDITPEMLKDTNALVTITGIYIPENGTAMVHQLDIPIVASHDPNKMSLKQARLSYRLVNRKKKLKYKVQFQNDGEGDAKNIRLEVQLPPHTDPESFELLHLYPRCVPCRSEQDRGCWKYDMKQDTLSFLFKGVSLPGSKAEDVTDKDSTKGFIQFTVRPARRLPNEALKGRTQIFFDKNDPITTNYATGRFIKSLSPILIGGWHGVSRSADLADGLTSLKDKGGWMAGIGLAPLAPYRRPYLQVELYVNTWQQSRSMEHIEEKGEVQIDGRYYGYMSYSRFFEERYTQLRIVPLQVRYNINSFLSVGAGLMGKIDFNRDAKESKIYNLFGAAGDTVMSRPIAVYEGKLNERNFGMQPFIDVNIGRVYLGPAIGLRYIYTTRKGQFMDVYAAWRF